MIWLKHTIILNIVYEGNSSTQLLFGTFRLPQDAAFANWIDLFSTLVLFSGIEGEVGRLTMSV